MLALASCSAACASLGGLTGGSDGGDDAAHTKDDVGVSREASADHSSVKADAGHDATRDVTSGGMHDAPAAFDAHTSHDTGADAPLACDAGGQGAVGVPACGCASTGALACAGNAQRTSLVCVDSAWTIRGSCEAGSNCETASGSATGTCMSIDPLCADAAPGGTVCATSNQIAKCNADLTSHTSDGNCGAQACVGGVCAGTCSPGATECATHSAVATCSTDGMWVDAGQCGGAGAMCSDGGCVVVQPAFYVGPIGPSNTAIAATSATETAIGDLLLLAFYLEPNGEGTAEAAYPALTPPAGFTLAPREPISSNDANLTSEETNRSYIYYRYAATAGAVTYSVGASPVYYADTVIVTVHGYATSGDPFADTTAEAETVGTALVTAYPSVSITPAVSRTGFLWLGTTWHVGYFGNPTGWTTLLDANTLSLAILEQGAAATVTVAPSVGSTDLLTATLMSFRAP
jgi:hypothetical protein